MATAHINTSVNSSPPPLIVERGFGLIRGCAKVLLFVSIACFLSQNILAETHRYKDWVPIFNHCWHWLLLTFLIPSTVFCLLTSKFELDEAVHAPVLAASLLIIPIIPLEMSPQIKSDIFLSVVVYIDATYICTRFMLVGSHLRASLPEMFWQVMLFPRTFMDATRDSYFQYWVRPRTLEWRNYMSERIGERVSAMLNDQTASRRSVIWFFEHLESDRASFIHYLRESLGPLQWIFGIFNLGYFLLTEECLVVPVFLGPVISREMKMLADKE